MTTPHDREAVAREVRGILVKNGVQSPQLLFTDLDIADFILTSEAALRKLLQRAYTELDGDDMDKVRGTLLAEIAKELL